MTEQWQPTGQWRPTEQWQPTEQWTPPEPTQGGSRRRRRRAMAAAGVGVLAIAAGATTLGLALAHGETVQGTGQLAAGTTVLPRWGSGGSTGDGSGGYGGYGGWDFGGGSGSGSDGSGSGSGSDSGGLGGFGGFGSGGYGSGGTGSTGTQQQATAAQSAGVVDIDTVLGYQNAEAAGTGTVVTSSGEVLTNNHVIDGATKITVTVVSTGKTYTAKVVGTDPTADVAVLQLSGASGLQTANYGDDDSLAVGQKVTGVGNAGGTGGTPSAASGTITALNQSITASDEDGGNAEKLSGLIETNAPIEAGDSGGPLYDSSGKIVGMDTAASTNGVQTTAGYAIPIEDALSIAQQIETATASTSTIHLGNPAFLGIAYESSAKGAPVSEVLSGTPAAKAGIVAGDVITAVGNTTVASPAAVKAALDSYQPGQSVSITWTDTSGRSHHATVTLIAGPAD